jgi:hypothetical protein
VPDGGVRGIECGESAVFIPHEAVTHEVCVIVVSRDRFRRVDGRGGGEYGARGIERGESAVAGPQEAVTRDGVTIELTR